MTVVDAQAPSGEDSAPRPAGRRRARSRGRLAFDLTALSVVGVLLAGSFWVAGSWLYEQLYSPAAFVTGYLELLQQGRAADALAVPGVAFDSTTQQDARIPTTASEVLLRRAALAPLDDIRVIGEKPHDGRVTVTVTYRANGHPGRSSFEVERGGWIGIAPTWRFARSPLSVIDLTVQGAQQFDVNNFALDKRQLGGDGDGATPAGASVPLLVFSPGAYSITVDTPIAHSDGVAVLADAPLTTVPVTVQARPTAKFQQLVQDKVSSFLDACAQQEVLFPTGCPFGYSIRNRIDSTPRWSISSQPQVQLVPDGDNWTIAPASAAAHLTVEIKSIYDGSVSLLDQEVAFQLTGSVTVLGDGSVSIQIDQAE